MSLYSMPLFTSLSIPIGGREGYSQSQSHHNEAHLFNLISSISLILFQCFVVISCPPTQIDDAYLDK
jgi:hypothetical protein